METTIDQRLSRLEHEFEAIKHHILDLRPQKKDWRSTVGRLPDDEISRNAERLGREWRESANKAGN